ncbi:predicted protein [Scheffersomyces stipitis CBS 6054]|uniref:ER membrane protein complex subunit 2 n=1 Tax=Scheffersomyces stipitis (strain ATCC 58785 / CBS 6054 / NBRC 10063 / NRRL Y-11545) TaxID=322104 RepID=A3LVS1_PICST|nr:predicted protein [Scheffersomyces stipitis CBS 6054]ABN66829.2 predicted protein [Scheffersomyces stipitis CBS 6054]KAG2734752.1 hypothetical protein G9P44_002758 [Scheffersomyces stipitis]
MSDVLLAKNRLLVISSSGAFANFNPLQLQGVYDELDTFLTGHGDSLDSIELFTLYELQFYLSVMTNHDIKAKSILDRLLDQFGSNKKSQRIKLLQSIYLEAVGEKAAATKLLEQNMDETLLSRRLVTFTRNNENEADNEEYISTLNFYLNLSPSDLVAWAELAHEYTRSGHYDKAVFCYKEILLQEPHAYPIFYQVGLNYYYQFLQEERNLKTDKKDKIVEMTQLLSYSRDNFLRSIEICDVYSLSWVGLYALTGLKFNDKLAKVKEVSGYLAKNDKLRELSEKKIKQLLPEQDLAEVLLQLK